MDALTIRQQLRLSVQNLRKKIRQQHCDHPTFHRTLRGELGPIYLEYVCPVCDLRIAEMDLLRAERRRLLKKGAL